LNKILGEVMESSTFEALAQTEVVESKKSKAIKQVFLRDSLKSLDALYRHLKEWRNENLDAFRLDGHHSKGPANPAQWIYFEIQDFLEEDYAGLDIYKKPVTGADWNGTYFLTAGTRAAAVDKFIELYEATGRASVIFKLGYSPKKEGNPNKRKVTLQSEEKEAASGWFCKQYINKWSLYH